MVPCRQMAVWYRLKIGIIKIRFGLRPYSFHLWVRINSLPMTPTEKYKKIEKQFILSDSSVNEYGFRLLTDGYQLDAFKQNPIGYYMHRREDGVVLKWDELQIENDTVIGTPVINLSNERGQQTCDEVEFGFLNAASVGHIVVLEYSTDPALMLPGQTGPTITKWYNKECSLVDIPGNCHALTKLYDEQENELNLMDLGIKTITMKTNNFTLTPELSQTLSLTDNADEQTLLSTVQNMALKAAKTDELEADNKKLRTDSNNLQEQIENLNATYLKYEIKSLLDRALEDKKITNELKDRLAADYATNPEGLKALLSAMLAYRSIVDSLKNDTRINTVF